MIAVAIGTMVFIAGPDDISRACIKELAQQASGTQ